MGTGIRREQSGHWEASHGASALLPWTLLTSGRPESLFHRGHIPTLSRGQTVPPVSHSVSTPRELPVLLTTVARPLLICMFGCVPGEAMVVVGVAAGRRAAGLEEATSGAIHHRAV